MKKPLKSPVLVGLIQQYIVLNPTRTGGGQSDPRVHKFACYGRKTKKNPKRKDGKRRNAVRRTWGKNIFDHVNDDFRVFFVVGKVPDARVTLDLRNESNTFNDVIMGDFQESFYNNSWKLEMMFEYAYKHCTFDYLLKVDDDNVTYIYFR